MYQKENIVSKPQFDVNIFLEFGLLSPHPQHPSHLVNFTSFQSLFCTLLDTSAANHIHVPLNSPSPSGWLPLSASHDTLLVSIATDYPSLAAHILPPTRFCDKAHTPFIAIHLRALGGKQESENSTRSSCKTKYPLGFSF